MHIIIIVLLLLCIAFFAEYFGYIIGILGVIAIIVFIKSVLKEEFALKKQRDNFKLADNWYCHKCGTINSLNDSKCIGCGAVNKNDGTKKTKENLYRKSSLNYTPLSKKEIDKKYPVIIPKEYSSIPLNNTTIERGTVSAERVMFSDEIVIQTSEKFFAFDVETTGLKADSDRIIELGAVLFENGKPIKTFSSLVNPKMLVPRSATVVNHITTEMVLQAPCEEVIYPKLIDFFGEALKGEIVICAHNASFDMKFLSATLERLGHSAKIVYLDTLSISRYMLPDLDNHKQLTVAKYLEIDNLNAHRAASDAEVCGKILCHFIKEKLIKIEEAKIKEAERAEARRLKEEEKRLRQEAAKKAKEERERLKKLKEEEKQRKLIEKQNAQNAESVSKKSLCKAVIQLDDDFNVIKEYESVSEASRQTEINGKSIREVAKGRQKHAGGYVWRYKEEFENNTEV